MKYFFNIGTLSFLGVVLVLISLGFLVKYIKILIRAGKKNATDPLGKNIYVQAHYHVLLTQMRYNAELENLKPDEVEDYIKNKPILSTDINDYSLEED